MTIVECYQILEVKPGASREEVKKAWKLLAVVWHPDRFSNEAHRAAAEARLKRINAAYSTLESYFDQGGRGEEFADTPPNAEPDSVYVDSECQYFGTDPRLRAVTVFEGLSRRAVVRIATDGVFLATLNSNGIDEAVHYPSSTITHIGVNKNVFIRTDLRYKGSFPDLHPQEVILFANDPEAIESTFSARLRFRNKYFAQLFQKRMRELFVPVDAGALARRERAERERAERERIERERIERERAERERAERERRERERRERAERERVERERTERERTERERAEREREQEERERQRRRQAVTEGEQLGCDTQLQPELSEKSDLKSTSHFPSTAVVLLLVVGVLFFGCLIAGLIYEISDPTSVQRSGVDSHDVPALDELAISRNLDELCNQAYELRRDGRDAQAGELYREVLAVDPNHVRACNNLAWMLATAPSDAIRNGEEALRLALHAFDVASAEGRLKSNYYGTVAAAYAEVGDFHNAIIWQEACIENAGQEDDRTAAQHRLELFVSRRPFRGAVD